MLVKVYEKGIYLKGSYQLSKQTNKNSYLNVEKVPGIQIDKLKNLKSFSMAAFEEEDL
jgi:hypothetical protein